MENMNNSTLSSPEERHQPESLSSLSDIIPKISTKRIQPLVLAFWNRACTSDLTQTESRKTLADMCMELISTTANLILEAFRNMVLEGRAREVPLLVSEEAVRRAVHPSFCESFMAALGSTHKAMSTLFKLLSEEVTCHVNSVLCCRRVKGEPLVVPKESRYRPPKDRMKIMVLNARAMLRSFKDTMCLTCCKSSDPVVSIEPEEEQEEEEKISRNRRLRETLVGTISLASCSEPQKSSDEAESDFEHPRFRLSTLPSTPLTSIEDPFPLPNQPIYMENLGPSEIPVSQAPWEHMVPEILVEAAVTPADLPGSQAAQENVVPSEILSEAAVIPADLPRFQTPQEHEIDLEILAEAAVTPSDLPGSWDTQEHVVNSEILAKAAVTPADLPGSQAHQEHVVPSEILAEAVGSSADLPGSQALQEHMFHSEILAKAAVTPADVPGSQGPQEYVVSSEIRPEAAVTPADLPGSQAPQKNVVHSEILAKAAVTPAYLSRSQALQEHVVPSEILAEAVGHSADLSRDTSSALWSRDDCNALVYEVVSRICPKEWYMMPLSKDLLAQLQDNVSDWDNQVKPSKHSYQKVASAVYKELCRGQKEEYVIHAAFFQKDFSSKVLGIIQSHLIAPQ